MKKPLPIRTQIRIPQDLHARLTNEAAKNNSSLNEAMIFYIEKGLSNQTIALGDYMEREMIKIIESRLASAQQEFEKIISEKTDILRGLTQEDIDAFMQYRLENKENG